MYGGVGQYVVNGQKEYHVRFYNEDAALDILVLETDPFASFEMIKSMEALVKEAYDYLITQEEKING